MWTPFTMDSKLMDDLAQKWALTIATGNLPPPYRDHLAVGRLIALSKHPELGVRHICISDAIRRLVAKGLFASCKASFTRVFQNSQCHTPGLFSLAQTSRMGQHACFTPLLVFFIARQNVLTITPY